MRNSKTDLLVIAVAPAATAIAVAAVRRRPRLCVRHVVREKFVLTCKK